MSGAIRIAQRVHAVGHETTRGQYRDGLFFSRDIDVGMAYVVGQEIVSYDGLGRGRNCGETRWRGRSACRVLIGYPWPNKDVQLTTRSLRYASAPGSS